ncbi:MAG TPA: hypothetical protein VF168_12810 [Trueperaceae bacterium]
MLDLSFQQLLLRAGGVLLLSLVHGIALVLIARALGNKRPQYEGRLTINPFQHLDVLGAMALILFSYGWGRPVEVDGMSPRKRLFLALGSLLATLLVTLLLANALWSLGAIFPGSTAATVTAFARIYSEIAAGFIALNWFPLLPLTGGLLMPAISRPLSNWARRHHVLVTLCLLALILSGAVGRVLDPLRLALTSFISAASFA